jgi:uncharacterized protein (UPF0212 family)
LTEEIRELYVVVATALVPSQCTQTVAARSPEHAQEIMKGKYQQYKDFTIVDTFKLKDCPEIANKEKKD